MYRHVIPSASTLPNTDFYNLGWAIHKITDPNHNFVEYIYDTNHFSGAYKFGDTRLSSIIYGHEENGNKPVSYTHLTLPTNSRV